MTIMIVIHEAKSIKEKSARFSKYMRGKDVIVINGNAYDATSGTPIPSSVVRAHAAARSNTPVAVAKPSPKARPFSDIAPIKRPTAHTPHRASLDTQPTATPPKQHAAPTVASGLHQRTQRSQTLHRAAIKKPAPVHHHSKVQKSSSISRFGAAPVAAKVEVSKVVASTATTHSAVSATPSVAVAKANAVPAPIGTSHHSRQFKDHLIREGLDNAAAKKRALTTHKKSGGFVKKIMGSKLRTAAMTIFAVVALGGYLTYLNLPNISVRVASAQAGIEASYPSYSPAGYSFSGPVAYVPGEVTVNFASNTSAQKYAIKQKTSNWDSQAVLDNVVTKESEAYLTYSERGLTVYTYGSKAAWVNGGILYTISGDAPLSNEQVLRIATSM